MNKTAFALLTAGIIGLASAPAFAESGRQGGPDMDNPVPHTGAYADYNNMVTIPWVMGPAPSALVDQVTGAVSPPPSDEVQQGRGGATPD
jgi:hypothetical protein